MIEKPAAFDIPKSELLTWTEPCLRRVLWTRDSRFDTVYDLSFNFGIKFFNFLIKKNYLEVDHLSFVINTSKLSLYRPQTDINQVKPDFILSI